MPPQDVWKFSPVFYRTSSLWGRCPVLTLLLHWITFSRALGTADHVRSLDDQFSISLSVQDCPSPSDFLCLHEREAPWPVINIILILISGIKKTQKQRKIEILTHNLTQKMWSFFYASTVFLGLIESSFQSIPLQPVNDAECRNVSLDKVSWF